MQKEVTKILVSKIYSNAWKTLINKSLSKPKSYTNIRKIENLQLLNYLSYSVVRNRQWMGKPWKTYVLYFDKNWKNL